MRSPDIPDQVGTEIGAVVDLIEQTYHVLGVIAARYRLWLRGHSDKYVDDPAMWDRAEQALVDVLDHHGVSYDAARGEGAFYGPKIDIQIVDQAGREFTLSTVQVDLYQPMRFDLGYLAADHSLHRPVMIHRSIIGSLERLLAHLIEVYAGAFPRLARARPARRLAGHRRPSPTRRGSRAALHPGGSARRGLPARPRQPRCSHPTHRLVPYQAILGHREADNDAISLRLRTGNHVNSIPVAQALRRITSTVTNRGHGL
jgi:threonyl-tRNA synthetase